MKEIKLTHGLVTLVDDEDYEFLDQFKWHASKCPKSFYARRGHGGILMHRLILQLTNPIILCDHVDRDGLNNQRNNLRIVTRSQNGANRASSRKSSSKYLGVYWNKQKGKWVAAIGKDGLIRCLGSFNNEYDAALAYDKAAKIIHGEFASLNFIWYGV